MQVQPPILKKDKKSSVKDSNDSPTPLMVYLLLA